jgi:hypothetical protein
VAERTTEGEGEGEGETEGEAALREALWPDAAPDDGAWVDGPASEEHHDLKRFRFHPDLKTAAAEEEEEEEDERGRFAAALAAVHAWAEAALRGRAREGAALRRALAAARTAEGAARRALEDERATRQVSPEAGLAWVCAAAAAGAPAWLLSLLACHSCHAVQRQRQSTVG